MINMVSIPNMCHIRNIRKTGNVSNTSKIFRNDTVDGQNPALPIIRNIP